MRPISLNGGFGGDVFNGPAVRPISSADCSSLGPPVCVCVCRGPEPWSVITRGSGFGARGIQRGRTCDGRTMTSSAVDLPISK